MTTNSNNASPRRESIPVLCREALRKCWTKRLSEALRTEAMGLCARGSWVIFLGFLVGSRGSKSLCPSKRRLRLGSGMRTVLCWRLHTHACARACMCARVHMHVRARVRAYACSVCVVVSVCHGHARAHDLHFLERLAGGNRQWRVGPARRGHVLAVLSGVARV